jgi:hypothetical protein
VDGCGGASGRAARAASARHAVGGAPLGVVKKYVEKQKNV